MSQKKHVFSMSAWLEDLMRVTKTSPGQDAEKDLELYEAALTPYCRLTTKENLIKALSIYAFFPTVAELGRFFRNECETDTPKLPWQDARIDYSSKWYVPTKDRWFNHNEWDKNTSKKHKIDFASLGGVFENIVKKITERNNEP